VSFTETMHAPPGQGTGSAGIVSDREGIGWQRKVNEQWLMYCLVHNVEKLQHYGQIA